MDNDTPSTPCIPLPAADLRELIRGRLREAIEQLLEDELALALGAASRERTAERGGYRHGALTRQVVTEVGAQALRVPRGRLFAAEGASTEWRSQLLPRYQRRTRRVNEAIVGCYLAGANSRRIRRALAPLLGTENLSKSAISRLVQSLKTHFEAWRSRDLSGEQYCYLYLDATMLPIRLARRVVRMPVQVVIGVRPTGEKVLVSLDIAGSESTLAWQAVIERLSGGGLPAPALAIIDGNPGLRRALSEVWPQTEVQRCTKHKLENLLAKAPRHAHPELRRDYQAIIGADDLRAAQKAYRAFVAKWSLLAKEVVRSLEEAGEELLTFYAYPASQWKCLRTTNPIESVNSAFKRRTRSQGAFTTEDSALVLLWGLFANEQIRLKRIDGWKELAAVSWPGLRRAA